MRSPYDSSELLCNRIDQFHKEGKSSKNLAVINVASRWLKVRWTGDRQ